MGVVINTNISSIAAARSLSTTRADLERSMERLSSGKRINGAKDDAAGLAISETMTAQIRGLNQAVRNANDAVSMVQTAEGALVEVTNMLQRMRELAVQSSNGTLDDTQRGYLGAEYDALVDAIDKVSANTTWNGMALLGDDADTYTMQVGADVDGTLDITFELADASTLGVAAGDIDDQTDANAMIGDLDTALGDVAGWRADLGAKANQLSFLADNLSNVSMNTAASRSRILDTDYAQATTELARTQIIQQAATAMLAQANQQPQAVLALLK